MRRLFRAISAKRFQSDACSLFPGNSKTIFVFADFKIQFDIFILINMSYFFRFIAVFYFIQHNYFIFMIQIK